MAGLSIFALGEFVIGTATDQLFRDHQLNYVAGKYLTCLNSFIPAGSYILPGGDTSSKIPIIPKVSYLIESVSHLTLRVGHVGYLDTALVTLSGLESTPILFAWSDLPIFQNSPGFTSSLESFGFGTTANFNQVDQVSGVISGVDLDISNTVHFFNIHPLIGIPAFNFILGIATNPVNDLWFGYQVVSALENSNRILFPLVAQGLTVRQAGTTQEDTESFIVLRSENSHRFFAKGIGSAASSDSIAFNISPSNQFPLSRPGNVAFSQLVNLSTTINRRISLPAGFFCETIIMSVDNAVAADSTVSEQFLLAGGGTVDNVILTLAAAGTQQITQINRVISETIEISQVANAVANTEFVIEFRGQIAS